MFFFVGILLHRCGKKETLYTFYLFFVEILVQRSRRRCREKRDMVVLFAGILAYCFDLLCKVEDETKTGTVSRDV